MTPTPDVKPLSYRQRNYLFIFLFLAFVVLLPALMFYATGYRFDFDHETRNIVSTGGMYVSSPDADVQIYIDEEPVRNLRVFRNAAYIQNLAEGLHRLTIQGAGLHTWTKDLPVYSYIVTEAESFNMPLAPQARLITPYLTQAGESVVFSSTTVEELATFASTTNNFFVATSSATSTHIENPEYEFVRTLFGTTSTSSASLIDRVVVEVEQAFNFATSISTTSSATSAATTTKLSRNVLLFASGDEVYARWIGEPSEGPYYYCVDHESASSTVTRYGEHVYASIEQFLATSSSKNILFQNDRLRVCRDEIRIDRKQQNVLDFHFFPNSTDLVLLALEDGVYVVEIDDRAWQNTQLLFPGENLRMIVEGGRIYIFDGERYLEVYTELIEA